MLAVSLNEGFVVTQDQCDELAGQVATWFTNLDTRINDTEYLDYVKWNEYALATGRQITDPTLVTFLTGTNGAVNGSNPVSTAMRISIDDSTRNPRHKGGWYPPRLGAPVQSNGRLSESVVTGMLDQAVLLLNGINTYLASLAVNTHVGVWSRADKAVHVINRVRIGDVPDNVSRRRNHLLEHYLSFDL
jgi:hypothetical protein